MKPDENIDIYARWTQQTSWYKHENERNTKELTYLTTGLVGEAGEFADALKKMLRADGDEGWENAAPHQRLAMFNELSDVLWYLARLLIFFNVKFTGLAMINMVKLRERMIENGNYTEENVPWPQGLQYEDALKLTQHIESQIINLSATPSTDTDTSSKPL